MMTVKDKRKGSATSCINVTHALGRMARARPPDGTDRQAGSNNESVPGRGGRANAPSCEYRTTG